MSHEPYSKGGEGAVTEAGILQALENAPPVSVPEDFARRVAQRALAESRPQATLPLQVKARLRAGITPLVTTLCAVALFIALFAFAPHLQPSFLDLRFDLELLLLAELGGVGYLLARFTLR